MLLTYIILLTYMLHYLYYLLAYFTYMLHLLTYITYLYYLLMCYFYLLTLLTYITYITYITLLTFITYLHYITYLLTYLCYITYITCLLTYIALLTLLIHYPPYFTYLFTYIMIPAPPPPKSTRPALNKVYLLTYITDPYNCVLTFVTPGYQKKIAPSANSFYTHLQTSSPPPSPYNSLLKQQVSIYPYQTTQNPNKTLSTQSSKGRYFKYFSHSNPPLSAQRTQL